MVEEEVEEDQEVDQEEDEDRGDVEGQEDWAVCIGNMHTRYPTTIDTSSPSSPRAATTGSRGGHCAVVW